MKFIYRLIILAAAITLVRVNRRIAMEEVRCKYCGRKLGEIEGKAEIVCPRCKRKNKYDTEALEAQGE